MGSVIPPRRRRYRDASEDVPQLSRVTPEGSQAPYRPRESRYLGCGWLGAFPDDKSWGYWRSVHFAPLHGADKHLHAHKR